MSHKRHNTSSAEPDSPPLKRRKSSSYDNSSEDERDLEQPQVDVTFGQAGAFPGIANSSNDALFYGPANDGIDYLRMVRSEATTIPYILPTVTARRPLSNADADEEYCGGFFGNEEAFVAKPLLLQESNGAYGKPQQYCHDAILLRFYALRSKLRFAPALNTIQALPKTIPISFPASSKAAKAAWHNYVLQYPPHTVQLAVMDVDSVLELLRLITKRMKTLLRSTNDVSLRHLGAWIWTLLARCPERGEVGSEEIADLRACVRAAEDASRWVQDWMCKTEVVQESDDEKEEGSVGSDPMSANDPRVVAGHVVKGNIQLQQDLNTQKLDDGANTKDLRAQREMAIRSILEMIVTVVGEVYGQRDLLELRRAWG